MAIVVGGIVALQIDGARAAGEAGGWRVIEAGGSARYRVPGDGLWWQTATGDVIAAESEVVTDRGGLLTVGRAGDSIELGPQARVMLPAVLGLNRVWQDGGRVLYRSSPGRRLEVETPYASVRVRGTVFEATLEPGLLLVEVERGVVDVTTRDGAARIELWAGQAARVRAGEVLTLEVRLAPGEAFQPIRPRPPATAALSAGSRFLAAGPNDRGELHPSTPPLVREAPGSGPGRDDNGRSDDPAPRPDDGDRSEDRVPGGNGASGRDDGPGFAGDPGRGGPGAGDDEPRDAGSSGPNAGRDGDDDGRGKGDRDENDRGGKGKDKGGSGGKGKDKGGSGGKGGGKDGSGGKGGGKDGSGGKGSSGKGGGGKGKR